MILLEAEVSTSSIVEFVEFARTLVDAVEVNDGFETIIRRRIDPFFIKSVEFIDE